MIHVVLILKKSSGLKVWSKTYSEYMEWDEYLTSGLLSAIFNFTHELFRAEIQDVEIGPYKILFESGGEDLIIVAIFDKIDSIIHIKEKLIKVREKVLGSYQEEIQRRLNRDEDFKDMGDKLDKIIGETSYDYMSEGLKNYLIEVLKDFRKVPEILDCDIISSKGVPLLHEWKKDFLDLCLRQIDAFWKSKISTSLIDLDQVILSYQNRHVILFKINDNLVLSALIRRETPMGLATLLIEELAEKIMGMV